MTEQTPFPDFGEIVAEYDNLAAIGDYCTKKGAERLKQKIESYWAERGQMVIVHIHNTGFHPAIRSARFDVRSDMCNGMPRARALPASDREAA
jgi:hypothetical protein